MKAFSGNITRIFAAVMLATAWVVLTPLQTPGSFSARAAGPQSVADIAEGLLDAVVNISTSQKVASGRPNVPVPKVPEGSPFQDFFDDLFPNGPNTPNGGNNTPRTRQSLGSGFVIDKSGIIITNNHVIADADEITVNFTDGTKLIAELMGRDAKTDLAVLKVKPKNPLTAVSFGDSSTARIGDWVMAIGNPFGLGGSVTLGIVSAIGRDINSGPYDNFIQTDAAINRGNSGGPLFNMDGEVVGINTAIISPSGGSIGIGFSIPANLAKRVVDQLIEFGETRRGWLGVQIQTVTDEIAESLGLEEASGAFVGGVAEDGPAKSSGIKPGDIILKFDGKIVTTMRDLPAIVADTPVDSKVEVEVFRKGKRQTIAVVVGRLEGSEKQSAAAETEEQGEATPPKTQNFLGLELGELSDEVREEAKISSDINGLLITAVTAGSPAADKGIVAGEIIVQIGQEPVLTLKDAATQIKNLKDRKRKNALLMVSKAAGDIRFVVLPMQ